MLFFQDYSEQNLLEKTEIALLERNNLNEIQNKFDSRHIDYSDENLNTPLHLAIKHKDVKLDIVKYLISLGPDLEKKNNMLLNVFALLCTKDQADFEVAKYLIECGYDYESVNRFGYSPIVSLCHSPVHNKELIKHLADLGCELNEFSDFDRFTLLHQLVVNHSGTELLDYVISKGVDVNLCIGGSGNNILYFLCKSTTIDYDVLDFLVSKGANVNHQNTGGETIMCGHIFKKELKLIKRILELGGRLDIHDRRLNYPIHFTSLIPFLEDDLIEFVIEKSQESIINQRNRGGFSALWIYLDNKFQKHNLRILQKYKEKKANFNMKHPLLETMSNSQDKSQNNKNEDDDDEEEVNIHSPNILFSYCSSNKDLDYPILQYLLENGADPTMKNCDDHTPLFLRAFNSSPLKEIKLLVKYGANVKELYGESTLLHAYCKESGSLTIELAHYLVSSGIDINHQNTQQETCLHLICKHFGNKKQFEIIKFLFKNGIEINLLDRFGNTAFHYLCRYNTNMEIVKFFIDNGTDLKMKNSQLEQPLHKACQFYQTFDIIKLLIENGAPINTLNKKNENALMIEINSQKNFEIIKYFLKIGFDQNNVNTQNENSIMRFCKAVTPVEDVMRIFNLLRNSGADLKIIDNDNHNLLHSIFIGKKFNINIVKHLIQNNLEINFQNYEGETPLLILIKYIFLLDFETINNY
ncbi:ankyrin repeat ph and sec7 domain containing protein secg-related [Anaeramoeba flamelloides]|uniref:Ankyrin repeat ph and sec7 domain containing protein secg-related n=1 Tax=Anaeramoeba flamelloides TaxID=1746091 RepID=A0AAV8A035_9EUKA|nr:ankyrin repeat ph and sec7 domain containing protein secg-related [Anaeramoeba flamelloides]